ncbi:hypothetical protein DPMN_041299 [Dreissena polymorpha]|uniref:Uncharacterized protein n=1 Tax=Dreissena polymorpha TaxID=45954 RepID=A0A9D4CYD9_DREPO|nr:hypothetical protein DPMN_041299 [Dreissena polymorpha]
MLSQIISMEASMQSWNDCANRGRPISEMMRSMMAMVETLVKIQKRSVQPPSKTPTTVCGVAEEYTLSPMELRSLYQASISPLI